MLVDEYSGKKNVTAITPQTQTNLDTAIVGPIIDTNGFGSVDFAILYGTMTDADVTVAITLAESADSGMSGSNAVAAADLIGTLAAASLTFADDNKCAKLGYKGSKRYLRMTATPTGNNSGALPIAATCSLGHPRVCPQSTQVN